MNLWVVGLQTDDTLLLADDAFANDEDEAIRSAKILTKERTRLISSQPIKFNGMKIDLHPNGRLTCWRCIAGKTS